jgi:ferric-dicitrate binding protein FerR (iron transport regulator)
MNASDRLDDLLASWCDGVITPTLSNELDELIASDPAAARRAAVYFDLHRILHEQAKQNESIDLHESAMSPQAPLSRNTSPRLHERDTSQRRNPSNHETSNSSNRAYSSRIKTPSQRVTKVSGKLRASGRARSYHPRSSARFFAVSGFMLLTVVMLVLFIQPFSPQKSAALVWLEGQATMLNSDGPVSDNVVTRGTHFIAGTNATLCYADGSRFRLQSGSSLSLFDQNEKQVHITRGVIDAQVSRQPPGQPFRLITPSAELVVIGTEFRVVVDPEMTTLAVDKGVVQFISAGINEMVKAGGRQSSQRRQVLIAVDATWSYRDDGVNPPHGWQLPGFDAHNWNRGKAPFGYSPETPKREKTFATIIAKQYDKGPFPIATYFRHEFTVSSPVGLNRLVARLRRDSGAVIYLNGSELGRDGMPTGPIHEQSKALDDDAKYDEKAVRTLVFPSTALRAGINCVAVQVHQTDTNSADMLFELELIAESAEQKSP